MSFDAKLVRIYDRKFYFDHPYQPFSKLITFKNKSNNIYYVASRHQECERSQTRIEIGLTKKPDLIVIEGLHAKWGNRPNNWDDRIKDKIEMANGCDIYYAYKRAQELNIDYVGIELGVMKNYSSYERDIVFLESIYELAKKYKTILIIYGAGHFVQQELVLEALFGKPQAVF